MEQQFEKMIATDYLNEKEHAGISWNDMPPEMLAKIFPEFRYNDLYSASLVNKKFNAIASLSLTELKNIVEEARQEDNADLLVARCKFSTKYTQAVIMSAVERNLLDEELIDIACTSLEHAEIILKSRLIHRYFNNKNKSKEELAMSIEETKNKFTSKSSLVNLLVNLNVSYIASRANIRANDKILLAIANHHIDFAKLVLKQACNALNGYNLMKIATFSVEHAKAIFTNSEALARLKPGHILGIARSSEAHLRYILLCHLEKIDEAGLQQLLNVSKAYKRCINSCLISTIIMSPKSLVTKYPQLSQSVLYLLATEEFFSEMNPLWLQQKQTAPAITAEIEHAIRLHQCFFTTLNKMLIALLMEDSIAFAQVAFAHPNIHLILGQDLYDKVKNQLQNSLSEKQESESSLQKFTK